MTQVYTNQWEVRFKLNISKFQGYLEPINFIDCIVVVRDILEFKDVSDDQMVHLVETKF